MKFVDIVNQTTESLVMLVHESEMEVIREKWLDISRILSRIDLNLFPHSNNALIFEEDLSDLNARENIKKELLRQLEDDGIIQVSFNDKVLKMKMVNVAAFSAIREAVKNLLETIESNGRLFYSEKFQQFDKPSITQKSHLTKNVRRSKPTIIISSQNGIYTKGDKNTNYPIRFPSKRFDLLCRINEGIRRGSKLADTYGGSFQMLSKEISDINKNVKKYLKVEWDLIIPFDTNGYGINTTDVLVEFDI